MGGQVLQKFDRGEDPFFFRAQVIGVEREGFLHRDQDQQLQQAILDDIPYRYLRPGDLRVVQIWSPSACAKPCLLS